MTAGISGAQVLRVDSTSCGIFNHAAIGCLPPIELQRSSPSLFSAYEDSAFRYISGCVPLSYAQTYTALLAVILPDSIYLHESTDSATGDAQAGVARVDAAIAFTVPSDLRYSYHIWGTFYTYNQFGGTAIASMSLSKFVQAGDSLIASALLQSGPGTPVERTSGPSRRGFLDSGQYLYEAHASVEANPLGSLITAELWLRFRLSDVTTAVVPSTWQGVKSLYR